MADVFVSYAREDKDRIVLIVQGLKELGLSVWLDKERQTPGSHFDEVIEKEIAEANAVVVCWSRSSVKSQWVKGEAAAAIDPEKGEEKLVPCLLEPCKIPIQFQSYHAEELYDWAGDLGHAGWRKIVGTIGGLVKREGLSALLDARARGNARDLLAWAQQFPNNPSAKGVLDTIAREERASFQAELGKARQAIADAIAANERNLRASLDECAGAFNDWIDSIAIASYDARPNLELGLRDIEKSLAGVTIRELEGQCDEARREIANLKSSLDAAIQAKDAVKSNAPSFARRLGVALAACAIGGLAGFFLNNYLDSASLEPLQTRLLNAETAADVASRKQIRAENEAAGLRTKLEAAVAAKGAAEAARENLAQELTRSGVVTGAETERLRTELNETVAAKSKAEAARNQLAQDLARSVAVLNEANAQSSKKFAEAEELKSQIQMLQGRISTAEIDASCLSERLRAALGGRPEPSGAKRCDSIVPLNRVAPVSVLPPPPGGATGFAMPGLDWSPPKPGSCQIFYLGREIFKKGPCTYMKAADNYFAISAGRGAGRTYRAYWRRTDNSDTGKTARGRWNGPDGSMDSDLGELKPAGACWDNATVKICVW